MGRRRIDVRGLDLRPSRICWTRFLASQGNSRPWFDVSVMTCWEH
jgi:hypothetical protein